MNASSILRKLKENRSSIENGLPKWHPLGFISLVISKTSERILRLHYWPAEERKPKSPNWPIHTHRFDLESYVFYGQLLNRKYKISDGTDKTLFEVRYFENGSGLTEAGSGKLKLISEKIYRKGDTYYVNRGSFHETFVPEREATWTLVEMRNFGDTPPLVVGKSEAIPADYIYSDYPQQKFWNAFCALEL